METVLEYIVARQNICFPNGYMPLSSIHPEKLVDGTYALYEKGGVFEIEEMQINMVVWKNGGIAIWPLSGNKHTISFRFSGCIMAVFLWKDRWYGAHVNTASTATTDCKGKWIEFVRAEGITNLTMFRPDSDFLPSINRNMETWGLISEDLNCYSLYADDNVRKDDIHYNIRYIRQHSAGSRTADYHGLLSLSGDILKPENYAELQQTFDGFWGAMPTARLIYSPEEPQLRKRPSRCRCSI